MYRPIYGSGIEADSKNNYQVGWTNSQRVDNRFRSSGGTVAWIAVNERGGTGYSGGNGGTLKAAIQADIAGKPSGTDLSSVTWSPGNPSGDWENKDRHALPATTLTAGVLYDIVFTNTSSTQTTNYISLNETVVISGGSTNPRQPAFTDDFAVLTNRGSWGLVSDTPVIDLTYTNGRHDGNAYFQITVTTPPSDPTQTVISGTAQARERFTPKVDVKVDSMAFRVKRLSGSSPLTLTLAGGGMSVPIALTGTGIPISTAPTPANGNHWDEASLSGGRWLRATFAPVTLKAGTEYTLRASTAADTQYMAIPLREVSTETSPTWGSRAFTDGLAEKTANGTSWSPSYAFAPHDWQFYLEVAP